MSKIKIFALGGLNEEGKNMYVVKVDNDIFVFDAGLKYASDKLLGVDYVIPNFDYIKENIKNIKGLFITHGHEKNMGAVCDIVSEIPNLKIYRPYDLNELIGCFREIMANLNPSVLVLPRDNKEISTLTKSSEIKNGIYLVKNAEYDNYIN